MITYKARLVAQGCAQRREEEEGAHYAPVTGLNAIKVVVAISAANRWDIHHMDFKAAYLNATLERPVYIRCPRRYEGTHDGEVFYELKRTLYGLHQSGKAWNEAMDKRLKALGLKACCVDPCVYTLGNEDEEQKGIMADFVDDSVITGVAEAIGIIKRIVARAFPSRDLGPATRTLGINIRRGIDGKVELNQSHYIREQLEGYGMEVCKSVATPIDPRVQFNTSGGMEKGINYPVAIGSLVYLAQATRPNIAFAVSKMWRYDENPSGEHWAAVKCILWYLHGTIDYVVVLGAGKETVSAFVYSDWAGDHEDLKSQTGYCLKWMGPPAVWRSAKQGCTAASSIWRQNMWP